MRFGVCVPKVPVWSVLDDAVLHPATVHAMTVEAIEDSELMVIDAEDLVRILAISPASAALLAAADDSQALTRLATHRCTLDATGAHVASPPPPPPCGAVLTPATPHHAEPSVVPLGLLRTDGAAVAVSPAPQSHLSPRLPSQLHVTELTARGAVPVGAASADGAAQAVSAGLRGACTHSYSLGGGEPAADRLGPCAEALPAAERAELPTGTGESSSETAADAFESDRSARSPVHAADPAGADPSAAGVCAARTHAALQAEVAALELACAQRDDAAAAEALRVERMRLELNEAHAAHLAQQAAEIVRLEAKLAQSTLDESRLLQARGCYAALQASSVAARRQLPGSLGACRYYASTRP
jgi:hypothetical protein